jgi:hypothetical protein
MNPSFHVFRGLAAVAWGVAFVVGGALVMGFAYVTLTGNAPRLFAERPGIVIMLAGLVLTSLGVGQASRATYRYGESEKPVRRLGERLHATLFLLPLGLATLLWGSVKTFTPAFADRAASAVLSTFRGLLGRWLQS